ncbi:MAG: MBL fold metallo-hydrolase, partial [Alistipes sp.]|nr:MBL fold metallo-hydrolase [Alistipes sp.]
MNTNISDTIRYVGVDDLELDLFESQYIVPNGISYNSYLIFDEQVALMDAVDSRMCDEWLEKVQVALAGRTPDYLVVHHMEPDHSGSIVEALKRYPKMKIVSSARAIQMLGQFFDGVDFSHNTLVVKEGDALSLGSRELKFYTAAMVHWPEVIFSYDTQDKVVFSADAFGKFGALSHDEEWACEARRYYFNICGKYGAPVQAMLKKVAALDVACICPLHGPVLSENL